MREKARGKGRLVIMIAVRPVDVPPASVKGCAHLRVVYEHNAIEHDPKRFIVRDAPWLNTSVHRVR